MQLPHVKTLVPPFGVLDAPYVIIGEQPGKLEVVQRKPFVGPAGKELDKDLASAEISRPFCYLTNVIKDLEGPIYRYIQLYKNKRLLSEPIISGRAQNYLDYLVWELSQTSSEYFMALGAVALYVLTGRRKIGNWRGSVLPCTLVPGRKVISTYHPATVIPPRNQFLNKRLIIFDLKRYKRYVNNLEIPTERDLVLEPSFLQSIQFLDYCYQKGKEGHLISYDIEVFMNRPHRQISCISFAYNKHAISIPFVDNNGDYFTITQETDIWSKIAQILENPDIRLCGQNVGFDSQYLLHHYGIYANNMEDTMIAQNTIMADYPKGLDFITSLWTDHPYYKQDGKDFIFRGGSYKKFWNYNAIDSCICDEAFPKIYEEVCSQQNEDIYKNQRDLIEPLVYMMEKGLKVDVKKLEETRKKFLQELEDKQLELNILAKQPLNPNSPLQVKTYFEEVKKVKNLGGAKVSYDDLRLRKLAKKGHKEASLIRELRRLKKLASTYLNMDKVDSDGRMRCSYNPAGTRYSRLSSSQNIFGTGGNLQNWPHHLQNLLVPDEGYVYYAFDLSQAENRIVAYVGQVDNMIECFENEEDVHSKTSIMIIKASLGDKAIKNISPYDLSSLGDGTKDWRFWGKKADHGFNYAWGYINFSDTNELPDHQGKLIYNTYHGLYPGVQQNFHTYVKKCLRQSRILVNLMGRRTVFLGNLMGQSADELFKEAYSCIPQGTVGDVINKRGLNYIYYNQEEFAPIELLRQVHDEIGFQIPLTSSWLGHAIMLRKIKKSLEIPLTTHYGREFKIPADLTIGNHMNKDEGIDIKDKDFPSSDEKLAELLQTSWETLNRKDLDEKI